MDRTEMIEEDERSDHRWPAKGRTRPTEKPPRSCGFASMTSSIMIGSLRPGAGEASGTAVEFFTERITIRLSMLETRPSERCLAQEIIEGVHVAGDDPKLVVGRAGDRGALSDFGPTLTRLLEGIEVSLVGSDSFTVQ